MDNFIINREDAFKDLLSEVHYFHSLLQILFSKEILNTKDIENVQLQMLDLMTETVGYYTKNESASVKVEIAEQLMLSIYYTIGLFLKEKATIKESVELIKEKGIRYLFVNGEKTLREKVEECRSLLSIVQKTKLTIENYAYIDTIDYGIPLFFKDYNIRFASHETPGSIDYPLAVDAMKLTGIEYINDYLKKINLENMFCLYFDASEVEALLKGFKKDSHHMLINIFQLVLTNYLGSMIAGKNGQSLDITEGDRQYLKSMLEDLSKEELEGILLMTAEQLCHRLSIEDENLIEYISKTVSKITPEIIRFIKTDTLESIFITLSKSENNALKYVDGESVSNSRFRVITEEIRNCSNVEDKIEIIREELHSLRDLVDVLGSDCIFDNEFIHVFEALEDFELALLYNSIANDEAIGNDYGTESEKEWHMKFKEYFDSFDAAKRNEIIRMSDGIEL